ncbi:RAC-beta serine/threonine-protein kinase [Cucumispora dikerogammari]|nr:RAC-beta serine/threonine-protein kinase [Cucumispora dikerogammari]
MNNKKENPPISLKNETKEEKKCIVKPTSTYEQKKLMRKKSIKEMIKSIKRVLPSLDDIDLQSATFRIFYLEEELHRTDNEEDSMFNLEKKQSTDLTEQIYRQHYLLDGFKKMKDLTKDEKIQKSIDLTQSKIALLKHVYNINTIKLKKLKDEKKNFKKNTKPEKFIGEINFKLKNFVRNPIIENCDFDIYIDSIRMLTAKVKDEKLKSFKIPVTSSHCLTKIALIKNGFVIKFVNSCEFEILISKGGTLQGYYYTCPINFKNFLQLQNKKKGEISFSLNQICIITFLIKYKKVIELQQKPGIITNITRYNHILTNFIRYSPFRCGVCYEMIKGEGYCCILCNQKCHKPCSNFLLFLCLKSERTKQKQTSTVSINKNEVHSTKLVNKNEVHSTKLVNKNDIKSTGSINKNEIQSTKLVNKNETHSTKLVNKNDIKSTVSINKYDIKHEFEPIKSNNLNELSMNWCYWCGKHIITNKTLIECKKCKQYFHKNCVQFLPNSCGITLTLRKKICEFKFKHFNQKIKKKESIKDYNLLVLIAKGGFGKIILVESLLKKSQQTKNEQIILKVLSKQKAIVQNTTIYLFAEKSVLEIISLEKTDERTNFLGKMITFFEDDYNFYFGLQFYSGGNLLYFHKVNIIPLFQKKVFCAQILLAISFLHSKNIVHRDLKMENILLESDGNLKIIDFGLSKILEDGDTTNTYCGTISNTAPEVIKQLDYSYEIDWWSYGCLIYEMYEYRSCFDGYTHGEIEEIVLSEEIKFYKSNEVVKDLVRKLLKKDRKNRLGISGSEEIKKHWFFNDLDWDKILKKKYIMELKPDKNFYKNFNIKKTEKEIKISFIKVESKHIN